MNRFTINCRRVLFYFIFFFFFSQTSKKKFDFDLESCGRLIPQTSKNKIRVSIREGYGRIVPQTSQNKISSFD